MAYATRADLATYGGIAEALTAISNADQDSALAAASALADGYIGAAFDLPLTAYTADLTMRVCEITAYQLISGRGLAPELGADSNIRMRYEDALRWLRDIADEKAKPRFTDSAGATAADPSYGEFAFALSPGTAVDEDGELAAQTVGRPKPRGW